MSRRSLYTTSALFLLAIVAVPLFVYQSASQQVENTHAADYSNTGVLIARPTQVAPGKPVDVIWTLKQPDPAAVLNLMISGSTTIVSHLPLSQCHSIHQDMTRSIGLCTMTMPTTPGLYVFTLQSSTVGQLASNRVTVGSQIVRGFPSAIPTGNEHRTPSLPVPSSNPSVSPQLSCMPRPACLNSTPRCMIAEPSGGWCTASSTSPVTTNQ